MSYYGSGFNPAIVGRVLSSVEVSEDKNYLTLTFADGAVNKYRADGDCCSSTWIEHLTVPPDISGATILVVAPTGYADGVRATKEQYAESGKHREYLDELLVYQSSIKTDRGEVIVEYRNDSNGYYGGSLTEMALTEATS